MKKCLVFFLFSLVSFPVLASEWYAWEYFARLPERDRYWICGMDSASRLDKSKDVSIKLIEGTPFIQFDLHNGTWSFPKGASVPVSLDFDDKKPLDLVAYGDGEIVSIAIPVELTSTFLHLVNGKKRVRLFFTEGNEKVWDIGLDGASNALNAMLACFKARSSESKKSR